MSSDIFFISGHSFNLSKLLKACLFLVEKACLVSSNLIDFNAEKIVSEKTQDVRQISWSNKHKFDRWNLLAWDLFNVMIQNRSDICVDGIFRPAT